jgi:ABC-type uncharacterized transport system permease subunit
MATLLGILSIVAFLLGLGFFLIVVNNSIDAIISGILFVIFAIFLSAAAIVSAINSLKKQITKEDVIIHSESENNQNP